MDIVVVAISALVVGLDVWRVGGRPLLLAQARPASTSVYNSKRWLALSAENPHGETAAERSAG
jgi:hypothetical protein